MNRALFVAVLTVFICSASKLSAQSFAYRFQPDHESLTANVPLNEISTRAFRHFVKTYGYLPAAVWTRRPGGLSVRFFTQDSVQYLIQYSVSGRLLNTHVYYTLKNAPRNVCAEVQARYPRYDMVFINALEGDTAPIFEVGLLDDTEFLLVQVRNDEVTPVHSFAGYIKPY